MESYLGRWAVFAAGLCMAVIAMPQRVAGQETDYDLEKKKLEVAQAIEGLVADDAGLQRFFDDSYGYAVFPSVGKGGFVVGGAHGTGLVYEGGSLVGQSTLKQLNVGLQMGGQKFEYKPIGY